MTRQGWADKIANKAFLKAGGALFNGDVQPLLLAEHRRAVRVVRCELEKHQRRRECETNAAQRDRLGGAMLACSNILAALQKGRT